MTTDTRPGARVVRLALTLREAVALAAAAELAAKLPAAQREWLTGANLDAALAGARKITGVALELRQAEGLRA